MQKSKELSFLLTFEFNDSYRVNRHGTCKAKVEVKLAYESLILWQGTAMCKITKNGEISWDFPDECPFLLVIKTNVKTLYTDESIKEIFNKMKKRKGIN